MNNVGLVLEGGGAKGAFTVGVIECLLENKINFPYVIGVSAGAMNAVNFVSKQTYRGKESAINFIKNNEVISIKNIIKNKSLLDLDCLFDKIPNELVPFDYESYFNSNIRCLITVTNVETGEAEYLEENKDKKRLMDLLRASTALPYFTPMVTIDDKKYMDGGIVDSIPYKKAYKDGFKKQVVVLTKNLGYRKISSSITKSSAILFYNKYPNFVKAITYRYKMYNKQIEKIEKLEKEGKIIVIRPIESMDLQRLEKDFESINNFYHHGYEVTKSMIDKIKAYIDEE